MNDLSIQEYEIGLNVFKNQFQDPLRPKSQKPKENSPKKFLPHVLKMTPEDNRHSFSTLNKNNEDFRTPGLF